MSTPSELAPQSHSSTVSPSDISSMSVSHSTAGERFGESTDVVSGGSGGIVRIVNSGGSSSGASQEKWHQQSAVTDINSNYTSTVVMQSPNIIYQPIDAQFLTQTMGNRVVSVPTSEVREAQGRTATVGVSTQTQTTGTKVTTRKNAWGNMSYADLITNAILSTPDKRMTLSQIYDWMKQNIAYFRDRSDSGSSAGWKNSIRHNLSLHNRFIRLHNEGAGKSSWWILNPEAKPARSPRRRILGLDTTGTITASPIKSYEKRSPRARRRSDANNGTSPVSDDGAEQLDMANRAALAAAAGFPSGSQFPQMTYTNLTVAAPQFVPLNAATTAAPGVNGTSVAAAAAQNQLGFAAISPQFLTAQTIGCGPMGAQIVYPMPYATAAGLSGANLAAMAHQGTGAAATSGTSANSQGNDSLMDLLTMDQSMISYIATQQPNGEIIYQPQTAAAMGFAPNATLAAQVFPHNAQAAPNDGVHGSTSDATNHQAAAHFINGVPTVTDASGGIPMGASLPITIDSQAAHLYPTASQGVIDNVSMVVASTGADSQTAQYQVATTSNTAAATGQNVIHRSQHTVPPAPSTYANVVAAAAAVSTSAPAPVSAPILTTSISLPPSGPLIYNDPMMPAVKQLTPLQTPFHTPMVTPFQTPKPSPCPTPPGISGYSGGVASGDIVSCAPVTNSTSTQQQISSAKTIAVPTISAAILNCDSTVAEDETTAASALSASISTSSSSPSSSSLSTTFLPSTALSSPTSSTNKLLLKTAITNSSLSVSPASLVAIKVPVDSPFPDSTFASSTSTGEEHPSQSLIGRILNETEMKGTTVPGAGERPPSTLHTSAPRLSNGRIIKKVTLKRASNSNSPNKDKPAQLI